MCEHISYCSKSLQNHNINNAEPWLNMLVYDQEVNQDFLLLFGAETASKLLEKWDTSFMPFTPDSVN